MGRKGKGASVEQQQDRPVAYAPPHSGFFAPRVPEEGVPQWSDPAALAAAAAFAKAQHPLLPGGVHFGAPFPFPQGMGAGLPFADMGAGLPLPFADMGFASAPPPLPPLPACLFTGELPAIVAALTQADAAPPAAAAGAAAAPATTGAAEGAGTKPAARPAAKKRQAAAAAPAAAPPPVVLVDELGQGKMDRRTFFHGDGKAHTFAAVSQHTKGSEEPARPGERLRLLVEEVHFGNPRVGVMQADPAPMPQMLKWAKEKFEEYTMDVASISFGGYWVWCAVGVRSNRLLYAMKRSKVEELSAVVVVPPAIADNSEEIELTYGTSIQGIQLVP